MKKILSALLAAALLCAMFVMPSAAASATINTAADVPHLETAPTVDGVIAFNEYGSYSGLHSYSTSADQFTDDGQYNNVDNITDINFYIGWTSENLHMAWVVKTDEHTPFPKGTYVQEEGANYATMQSEDWPATEEEQAVQLKQMWMFSCIQFRITPGAPKEGTTTYQNDKNYLEVGFCEMDDGSIGKALWNAPRGIDKNDFNYNDWDAAVVRDDAAGTTTYEISIPAEMCGATTFGTDAQFGLGYAVAAQEHHFQKGACMIEWQDACLTWPGDSDRAGVMTFKGGDGSFETGVGDLPEGDIAEVEEDTALGAEESIVYVNNINASITDGYVSLMSNMEVSYNTAGNKIAAVLLAPTEDEGYYTVIGKGAGDGETVAFVDDLDIAIGTDAADNCILVAVDDTNAGYELIQTYGYGDTIGVWGFKFNEETLVPTALTYSNACIYISEYAEETDPGESSGDTTDAPSAPADDSTTAPSEPAGDEPTTPSTPTTSTPTTNNNTDDSAEGESNAGVIIGIVVGVIVLIGAAVAVVIVVLKKKKA